MRQRDVALAVGVAAIWGVNFVMIHVGLEQMPPLLFSTLRFGLAALPALFFVGRPTVAWRWLIAVALVLGATKFSLLFLGMAAGMPAGLSSVVLQSQAVFTVLFAAVLLRERPRAMQVIGLGIAVGGIALAAWRLGPDRPPAAFALVVGAAATWGVANIVVRAASPVDMLNFMVWVSALAAPVLALLSLSIEGPEADLAALRTLNASSITALLFIAGLSTLVGWGAWGALIRRYGASTVAPFSMLVPFFGIASGAVFLGETVYPTDIVAAALVIGGVLLGVVRRRRTTLTPAVTLAAVARADHPAASPRRSARATV